MSNICRKCTPGCKCNGDQCMMVYCESCRQLCRCWNEGRSIVNRIYSPRVEKIINGWKRSWAWIGNNWMSIFNLVGAIAAYCGVWKLMTDFNAELETVPHGRAVRLGMTIILLAIVFSRKKW